MKGKIVLGSILAVLLITLVPATNAIQIKTMEQDLSKNLITYDQLKNMDAQEITAYIQMLCNDYPALSAQFQHAVEDLDITTGDTHQQGSVVIGKNQGRPQPDGNQTLLEKIFWKIYNYRVIRLLISLILFLKIQSKFTLLRTTTWGIRLLRWVKLGILLGYIDPSGWTTQTPSISFQQDPGNSTLTVTYTSANDILWSDIAQIGAGSCDPFPAGNVTVGDIITNCTGILVLQYLPTYEVLGVYEFA